MLLPVPLAARPPAAASAAVALLLLTGGAEGAKPGFPHASQELRLRAFLSFQSLWNLFGVSTGWDSIHLEVEHIAYPKLTHTLLVLAWNDFFKLYIKA